MKELNNKLPVWTSNLGTDRLDNNYYSPSYFEAKKKLKKLGSLPFNDMIEDIETGLSPNENGNVPALEGRNIFPNIIFPNIEKHTEVDSDSKKGYLKENDILVIKDGSPGVFAVCSAPFLEYFNNKVVASQHLYVLRLKDSFKEFASFIVLFLNSKTGQSLVRRNITGAISPSIRGDEIKKVPILDPLRRKRLAVEMRSKLEDTQKMVIAVSNPVNLSKNLFKELRVDDHILNSLPINWMPGGKRDAHGYYKD